jgi:hypothetical protein
MTQPPNVKPPGLRPADELLTLAGSERLPYKDTPPVAKPQDVKEEKAASGEKDATPKDRTVGLQSPKPTSLLKRLFGITPSGPKGT